MRYFCWNLVSTPSPKSDGYPILKLVAGSKRVRGRKKRKKASNHAVRNAATALHTKMRRWRFAGLSSGPTDATPPAAAAFDVPTAGVPTYRTASPVRVEGGTAGAAGLTADAAAGAAGRAAVVAGAGTAGVAAGVVPGASPSRVATSASVSGGRPVRFRRACSAATDDLPHLRPPAINSARAGVIVAVAAGAAGAGVGAEGAAAVVVAAGAPAPTATGASPRSQAMGSPALRA